MEDEHFRVLPGIQTNGGGEGGGVNGKFQWNVTNQSKNI